MPIGTASSQQLRNCMVPSLAIWHSFIAATDLRNVAPIRKRNVDAMSAALEVAMTPQKQMKTARVASPAASSAASTAASPAPSSAASSADSTAASPAASPAASRAVSPAPAPQNVPRAVAQIRARPGQQVAKLNVDNMFGEMTAKEVNAFQNNFRNSLTKQQKGDFSAATRADKRTWMLQWILDPALCQKEGFNVTKTYDTTESRAEDRWVTKEIMSGSRCLNSEAHADALVKSGELEERPHRFGALAAQGILEYLLTDESCSSTAEALHDSGRASDERVGTRRVRGGKHSPWSQGRRGRRARRPRRRRWSTQRQSNFATRT